MNSQAQKGLCVKTIIWYVLNAGNKVYEEMIREYVDVYYGVHTQCA